MDEFFDISELDEASTLFELVDDAPSHIIVTREGNNAYAVIKYDKFEKIISLAKQAKDLQSQLAQAKQEPPQEVATLVEEMPATETARPTTARHEPYESVELPNTPIPSEDYTKSAWQGAIIERMKKVMAAESPIEKQRLFNMVRGSFGIKRSGRDVQSHNEWLFDREIERKETSFNDTTFVWLTSQDPETYDVFRPTDDVANRQITEYPYQELKAALQDALSCAQGLSRDELIDATMRLLGYKRKTNRVKEVVGAAIEQAVNEGILALMPDGTFKLA